MEVRICGWGFHWETADLPSVAPGLFSLEVNGTDHTTAPGFTAPRFGGPPLQKGVGCSQAQTLQSLAHRPCAREGL